jgi:cell division protein FtsL
MDIQGKYVVILVIIALLLAIVLAFVIIRNRKDRLNFEKDLNELDEKADHKPHTPDKDLI